MPSGLVAQGRVAAVRGQMIATTIMVAGVLVVLGGCVIHRTAAPQTAATKPLGDTVDAGTPVTVLAVHPEDAYKPLEKQLRGRACVASDLLTKQHTSAGDYYSGSINCDADGYYFYKVQLSRREGASAAMSTAVLTTGEDGWPKASAIPAVDTRWKETIGEIVAPAIVQILSIHEQDAYKSKEAEHVGNICRVTATLTNNGDGFFGGAVTCRNGSDPYYYKAQVRIISR